MNRHLGLLLVGQVSSATGDAIGRIAIGWLVYEMTDSVLALGTIALVSGIAEAIVRLFGSPALDRVERLRFLVCLDGARMIIYAITPILSEWGWLEIWHLYVLAAVGGGCGALFRPGISAAIPTFVNDDKLVRAISVQNGAMQLAMVLGPGVGGLIVSHFGATKGLVIDALTFGISALTLTILAVQFESRASRLKPFLYLNDLNDGLASLSRVPVLLTLTILGAVANIGIFAASAMTVPFVRERLAGDAQTMGLLHSAWGLGFVVGSALMGMFGLRFSLRLMLLVSLITAGICNAGLAVVQPNQVLAAFALQGVFGFSMAIFNINYGSICQRLTPEDVRGRAASMRALILQGASSFGAWGGSAVSASVGMSISYFLFGMLPIAASLVGWCMPHLRQMAKTPSTVDQEAAA